MLKRNKDDNYKKKQIYFHYFFLNSCLQPVDSGGLPFIGSLLDYDTIEKRDPHRFCEYHKSIGYTTKKCIQLKTDIEKYIQQGHLKQFGMKDKGSKHVILIRARWG